MTIANPFSAPRADESNPFASEIQQKCPNAFVGKWIEECAALNVIAVLSFANAG